MLFLKKISALKLFVRKKEVMKFRSRVENVERSDAGDRMDSPSVYGCNFGFMMTIATQSTVSDTQLQNEESELLYRSQVATLHVTNSSGKRNVLDDFENQLYESEEFSNYCKASIPGFDSDEPFYIQKTGDLGPECQISSLGFEQVPYLESENDQTFENLVVLWS